MIIYTYLFFLHFVQKPYSKDKQYETKKNLMLLNTIE